MKYNLRLYYKTYIHDVVEADNIQDAIEIARNNIDSMDDDEYKDTLVFNIDSDEIEVTDEDGNVTFYPL